jgi:hypothetical protein
MCEELEPSKLEDTFIMGNRLLSFLSSALPSHPEYMQQSMEQERNETFRNLVWINARLDKIALKIDEEQLNKYITDEYVPDPGEGEDDSSEDSSSHDEEIWRGKELVSNPRTQSVTANEGGWESFEGWSLDVEFENKPQLTESDSSVSSSKDASVDGSTQFGLSFTSSPMSQSQHEDSSAELGPEPDFADPELEIEGYEEDEDLYNEEDHGLGYSGGNVAYYDLQVADGANSFLRRIAREEVPYETDSEACDSWAQEIDNELDASDDDVITEFSSSQGRLALQEIKNAKPSMSMEPLPVAYHVQPKISWDDEDMPEDEASWSANLARSKALELECDYFVEENAKSWASFDSASVRQAC